MQSRPRPDGSRRVSATRVIHAPPATIFGVLTDITLHPVIDGSGTVRRPISSTPTLVSGSRFSMGMRLGIPYRIANEVVEFEQDRLIAWRHLGHHRWRWELEPLDHDDHPEGSTRVTETFDWSTSRAPRLIELAGSPARNLTAIERTLELLDAFVTHREHAF